MLKKNFSNEDAIKEMCKNLYNMENITEEENAVLSDPERVA
jgi:hypothetical protein